MLDGSEESSNDAMQHDRRDVLEWTIPWAKGVEPRPTNGTEARRVTSDYAIEK
jgi:hypothetical protein